MGDDTTGRALDWEYDVPLFTNRHFLGAFAKAMFGGGLLIVALVSFGLGVQGDWEVIPRLAGLLLSISAALFLLGLLLMAFPFRNRLRTRFTVDGEGVRLRVVDGVARAGSRASFVAGLVLGKGAAAGAGLLAATQEDQLLRWSGAFVAVPDPATRTIAFRNGWMTLMRVYCTPQGFGPALAAVERHMAGHGTAGRRARRSPLGGYLLRTALVVVAMVPVFAAREAHRTGLLAPWILLCFALALVWLIRPLAWVVLLLEAVLVALAVPRAGRLSGDDWLVTTLALGGLAFVAWLAIASLRGRVKPALEANWGDAGESSGLP